MGLFNFKNKQSETNQAVITSLPIADTTTLAKPEEKIEEPASTKEADKQKPLVISYATGWPIDIIYGYLHKNYEDQGFNDSMVKSDLSFRDMNKEIIRNKILMVFRQVNLKYDVMKRDIEIRIQNCEEAGLLTTATELRQTLNIIMSHKGELQQLQSDFINDKNEASIPLKSYECGFLRGIATIATSIGAGMTKKMSQNPLENISEITMTA